MTKDEALKLALEALEEVNYDQAYATEIAAIRAALASKSEALAQSRSDVEQPAQPIRWDSNAVDMTGAMATLPKTGSESVVDYKPVISDVGADANIPAIPGTYYGIVPKGTGKITVREALAEQPNNKECESELASQPLYEGITQNTQYHYSKFHSWFDSELHRQKYTKDHPAYLAAQEAWNAANDAAQHRINRLNAEIEAWKVRFKIAEDALAKLNGPEQKPVAWADLNALTEQFNSVNCGTAYRLPGEGRQPLYPSPPASKPWVGLTEKEHTDIAIQCGCMSADWVFYGATVERILKEKNS